uniref:Uncharacterized protein n=1 Tax=Arundo donax TaxID=35708 RepID=A0A0A9FIF8_ARUDO
MRPRRALEVVHWRQLLRQAAQHRVRVLRGGGGGHPVGHRAEPLDVPAQVEVGDGVQAPVLDGRHVVRHRRLLLRRVSAEVQILVAENTSDPRLPSPVVVMPRDASVFRDTS